MVDFKLKRVFSLRPQSYFWPLVEFVDLLISSVFICFSLCCFGICVKNCNLLYFILNPITRFGFYGDDVLLAMPLDSLGLDLSRAPHKEQHMTNERMRWHCPLSMRSPINHEHSHSHCLVVCLFPNLFLKAALSLLLIMWGFDIIGQKMLCSMVEVQMFVCVF